MRPRNNPEVLLRKAKQDEFAVEKLLPDPASGTPTAADLSRRLNDAIVGHDWEAVEPLFAPDVVREDRRRTARQFDPFEFPTRKKAE